MKEINVDYINCIFSEDIKTVNQCLVWGFNCSLFHSSVDNM